jgi:hypothetical protein
MLSRKRWSADWIWSGSGGGAVSADAANLGGDATAQKRSGSQAAFEHGSALYADRFHRFLLLIIWRSAQS